MKLSSQVSFVLSLFCVFVRGSCRENRRSETSRTVFISAATVTSGRASSHSYPQGYLRDEPQTSHNSPTDGVLSATAAPNNQPKIKNTKSKKTPGRERGARIKARPSRQKDPELLTVRDAVTSCDRGQRNYAFQRP